MHRLQQISSNKPFYAVEIFSMMFCHRIIMAELSREVRA